MAQYSWSMNNADVQTVPEISPLELLKKLEAGEPVQIVDVRARSGNTVPAVGLIPQDRLIAIVGSRLVQYSDLAGTGIDPSRPVVVICAHGNDSKIGALHLNRLGAKARSLTGGMAAWMKLSVPRTLPPPAPLTRLVQFDRIGKEALSYVLVSDGEAMIIDPPRDFSAHLQFVVETGAVLIAVADTHVHADYISGGPEIARRLGIPYYLHPGDSVYPYNGEPGQLDFTPLMDGRKIDLGRCALTVEHTPGHSPGSVTFRIEEEAAFTGDFLFLNSIGRPDLAEKTEEWASQLWRSIQRTRSTWPKTMMVYPAHYTSNTPRLPDRGIGAPFAQLLSENPGLQEMDEETFLRWIEGRATSAPPAYRTIKGINVGIFTADEIEAEFLENGKNECAIQ